MKNKYCTLLLIAIFIILASFQTHSKEQNYQLTTLAEGLNYPWSIAFLPNGDFLLSMRSGELRILSVGGEVSEPIANTPEAYVRSQGGYFDVVLDPNFSKNQTLYLAFAYGLPKANATRIIRAKLVDNRLENVQPIFTVNPTKKTAAHYGGRMVFLNDGTLLLTTGDGFQQRESSQDASTQLGKIVRINSDGSTPEDNPFVGAKGSDDKIYSLGHRSPQGLAYDSKNNIVYAHEHGPKGGDEVNIIQAGENYGWPVVTHGVNYSGAIISPYKSLKGFADPIKVWVPSVAPSGLAYYDADAFPNWQGSLFVGTLVNHDVRRLELKAGKVTEEEILFAEIDERIRDIKVGLDGLLYILTDSKEGKVIRVEPQAK